MEEVQETDFIEPDFVSIHIKIRPFHKRILDTVDENTSNAVRKVIDEFYRHNQSLNKDKMLIDFCLGMMLVGIGTIINIWYATVVFFGVGIGCIVYGIGYYFENRRNRI